MGAMMELIDDSREFFAPCSSDMIDGLLGQYQAMRGRIDKIAGLIDGEMAAAMQYFLDGNRDAHSRYAPAVKALFNTEGAIKALNSAYWSKTMALTDVLDCMPQKRRDEWHKSITEMTTPEFTEEAVRPTISELLSSRQKFFAERVDGIFRNLSGEHVTNSPAGFNKRMIIAGVTDNFSYTSSSRAGTINDLRAVIAKFMGRDEPKWNSSTEMISAARRNHGEWMILDGGALRIRVYMKGTAHLEVHPDIAYRLNQVLAGLYPMAIPSEFRSKPKKPYKEFQMMGRPLPFLVLEHISGLRRQRNTNTFEFAYGTYEGAARDEAIKVLASIGGVRLPKSQCIEFDYDPRDALDEIITSGCIPDRVAHQFYPTPENIARAAIELAGIREYDTVLEPSAGQGNIAALLPTDRTTCVEISPLHCAILKARGFNAIEADFIKWAETAPKFDRIVMNPPFSEGRAKAHVEAAAGLVKNDGRLVAILPASFKDKDILPGWDVEWSRAFDNEFAGTSVSVVILSAHLPTNPTLQPTGATRFAVGQGVGV